MGNDGDLEQPFSVWLHLHISLQYSYCHLPKNFVSVIFFIHATPNTWAAHSSRIIGFHTPGLWEPRDHTGGCL